MPKIFVAGHNGMVGHAIMRRLRHRGARTVARSKAALDLTAQSDVRAFMRTERPDIVILAAARVGGIMANRLYPARFLHDNLLIAANVIHESYAIGVARLLFLGSSCIYPRDAAQPIREESLLTGALEPTNAPYAIAKIAGLSLCDNYNREYGTDFRTIMAPNLYGPHDNFDPLQAHVLPALLARFHAAKRDGIDHVTVWGSGQPRREFMHVDDLVDGALFVLDLPKNNYAALTGPTISHVNVGTAQDITIAALAQQVAVVTGFTGDIRFDPSQPDGTPRKCLDTSRLDAIGWRCNIALNDGLTSTYRWFRENQNSFRGAALEMMQ